MSFFSRFFKASEPETLETKITKVVLQPQEQLLSTALQADEEALRLAAIHKLNYSSDLIKIATSNQQPKQIVTTARKRIGELLDDNSINLESLSKDVQDQTTLLSLCGYSKKAGVSVVDRLTDESVLLDVAQTGTTTQIRQAAAQKLITRDVLNQLLKTAKNKDKSVLKIAKSKLDVFRQADEKEAETDAQVDAVCKQAEQLAKRDIDDIFHARKKQIEGSWADIASLAKNEAQERFKSAIATSQQKLDALLKAEQDKIEQDKADKEAKKDLHSALHTMQELISRLYTHEKPQELEEELNSIEGQQQAALSEAKERGLTIHKEHKRAEDLAKSARSLIEKLKTSDPIPKLLESLKQAQEETGKTISRQIESILIYAKSLRDVPTPEIVTHSREVLSEWRKSIKQQTDKSKEKVRETSELIRKANWAVSQGYVGRARAIFKDLEEKVHSLEQVPSHIESKFEDIKESMKKLGDWHEFAVTPKKEALVEKMQSLINSTLHPRDLADKIHSLQDSWKELCKGGQNQDETLWNKFHEASQTSYERCKTYFDEQTKTREANAELRLALLAHLEQYEKEYNWDNANWKEVESTLRVSRETWQSYWPIPRKQIKELQTQFDGILDRIFALRNTEFDANKAKKQGIVELSGKLAESEDIRSAIDSAKGLQAQWQKIGRCKRKDDQELWKAFRANCDAIFEKRNQENEAENEERDAAKTQAESIITQLQAILDIESSAFFEARNQCSALTETFQNIGELPRDSFKALNNQYYKLIEDIESRVEQERQASAIQVWVDTFTLANKIRSYELQCIKNENSDELKGELETAIASFNKWPTNSTLNTLQKRITKSESLNEGTATNSLELLRTLCVKSEILTNNDSPEEEKAYRMAYQVNQLKDGFGQASGGTQGSTAEAFNEWLSVPAVPDEQYPTLLARFAKCWDLKL